MSLTRQQLRANGFAVIAYNAKGRFPTLPRAERRKLARKQNRESWKLRDILGIERVKRLHEKVVAPNN